MEKELTELTDHELLEKKKKVKSNNLMNALILGVLIGIAIFSTVKNGLGLLTFIPLVFAFFAANKWKKKNQALEKELNSRNLK